MILHQTVEEDLVLIPHGSEERVFEDDGGLFLELMVGSCDSAGRARRAKRGEGGRVQPHRLMKKLIPHLAGPQNSLLVQIMNLVRNHPFQPKDRSFFPSKRRSLWGMHRRARGVSQGFEGGDMIGRKRAQSSSCCRRFAPERRVDPRGHQKKNP